MLCNSGVGFFFIALFPTAAGAVVYKCEVNGQTVFSDKPCATDAEVIDLPAPRPGSSRSSGSSDDYYSPKHQLERMQQARERELRERRMKREMDREEERRDSRQKAAEAGRGTSAATRKANCDYYSSMVEEWEHRLYQPYRRESERLHREAKLNYYKRKTAESCD